MTGRTLLRAGSTGSFHWRVYADSDEGIDHTATIWDVFAADNADTRTLAMGEVPEDMVRNPQEAKELAARVASQVARLLSVREATEVPS